MIKKDGIVESLSWVELLINLPSSTRKGIRKICLKGIKLFKRGEVSDQGDECVRFLKEDCKFIGYAVNICYVMESGSNKQEENSLWVHPFSVPTPLYKVKGSPLLVVGNENLEYNNSVLSKIPANKYNKELLNFIKGTKGIQG